MFRNNRHEMKEEEYRKFRLFYDECKNKTKSKN